MTLTSGRFGWILGTLVCGAAWISVSGDNTTPAAISHPRDGVSPALENVRAPTMATPRSAAGSAPALRSTTVLSAREGPVAAAAAARLDLFAAREWAPLPPPLAIAPTPEPTAPPLPYVFAGKKLEAGRWEVYLLRGETSYIVREGANLEDGYVVNRIDPPIMTFTYRPLNQQQRLSIDE